MLSWARPSLAVNLKCPVMKDTKMIWNLNPEICNLNGLLTADARRQTVWKETARNTLGIGTISGSGFEYTSIPAVPGVPLQQSPSCQLPLGFLTGTTKNCYKVSTEVLCVSLCIKGGMVKLQADKGNSLRPSMHYCREVLPFLWE